jgi:hypothetical protein
MRRDASLATGDASRLEIPHVRWVRAIALGLMILFQAWLLFPELRTHPTPLNDDAFHLAASLRIADALREAPWTALDPWFSYWSLGYPLLHAYQPLAHTVTGALTLLSGSSSALVLFDAIKFVLLLAFPLCVYRGARWLELSEWTALGAALTAPLIATDGLYGFEYGSYLWRGSGLYTQLWAMDLLPLAIGRGWSALRGRSGTLGASTLLALTLLAHTVFGYVAGITLVLAALVLLRKAGLGALVRRGLPVALLALSMVAFFVVPLFADGAINHSRWEPAWKWDSYGHVWVLSHLANGELFDHGRAVLLTLMVVAGLYFGLRRSATTAERFCAVGFMVWLALYCGRPTWGLLLGLIGLTADAPLHRLLGAVHLFGILLAGLTLGGLAQLLIRPGGVIRRWAAVGLVLVALGPAAWERRAFVQQGIGWFERSEAAVRQAQPELGALRARLLERTERSPDRIYPGLAGGWGNQFRVGEIRMFDFLSLWRLDAVAFLFHAMSLPSDVMVEFDENQQEQYDLFDIGTVVTDASHRSPAFATPGGRVGRFALGLPPSTGRIGLARATFVSNAEGSEIATVSSEWLKTALPARHAFGIFGRPFRGLPVLDPEQRLPAAEQAGEPPVGSVHSLRREHDDWSAVVSLAEPALVVLKESYHPGWRAEIDGQQARTLLVTPGFVAVAMEPGTHRVSFRFRPSALKVALFLLALLTPPAAWGARRISSRSEGLETAER